MSIRRHCMQNLLHELLVNERQDCSGLLAKAGNIVVTHLNVTQNLISGEPDSVECLLQQQAELDARGLHICGIYHSTHAIPAALARLTALYQSALGHPPECYLRLDPDQPGRIDARLYHDVVHRQQITLNMVEDDT